MVNRYAVIENGVVKNIALAEPEFAQEQGWVLAPDGVSYGWTYTGSVFSPLPPPSPPTSQQLSDLRSQAYRAESDPLFFKYQRGEATEQEWLDKIEEIKLRYPYPEVIA